jgi:hypothetical protein
MEPGRSARDPSAKAWGLAAADKGAAGAEVEAKAVAEDAVADRAWAGPCGRP